MQNLEKDIDIHSSTIEELLATGESLSGKAAASGLGAKLKTMAQKWSQIQEKRHDRRKKLEEALKNAEEFERMMIELEEWLTYAEGVLNSQGVPSRLLGTLTAQMSAHAAFSEEATEKRAFMSECHTKGTKLQYHCTKSDAVGIKNRLVSAKHRMDKVRGIDV